MRIKVSEVQVPKERLRLLGDYSELAQSMSGPVGQINPITVTPQASIEGYRFRLVAGLHRLRAAEHNGEEFIEASMKHFENERQETLAEIDENLCSVPLDAGERSRHTFIKHRILLEEGKALKKGHRADYASRTANFAEVQTTPELAEQMGKKERTEREDRRIYDSIPWPITRALREHKPYIYTTRRELQRLGRLKVDEQYLVMYVALHEQAAGRSIGVFDALRKVKRHLTAQLAKEVQEPTGKYRTIVLDPPWDGKDSGDVDPFNKLAPAYRTMSLEEIRNLPVADLAEENDCHLYLWVTDRMLKHGLELMEHYGFRYLQSLVWKKHRIGTGRYYRHQHELCLFGLRGTRLLARTDAPSFFEGERGDHSAKPDIFFELVKSCSPGPRISLFDRAEREGFDTWGTGERSEQSSMVRAG